MKFPPSSFVPRAQFPPHNVPLANFAEHHRKALADIRQLSGQVDIVLELRDARAPLSSYNPLIRQALPGVPHMTLYTKTDKSTVRLTQLEPLHPDDMFRLVSMQERKYARRILLELISMAGKQNPPPPLGFKVLVAGMPNAGKSTLINLFRQVFLGRKTKKVARTGSQPGITRAMSEQIMISREPKIYVLDSPGVLMPQLHDWEQMLKLCLVGAIPRKLVDPMVLADYLLYQVNKRYPSGGRYPGELSNDIETVLWNIANTNRRRPSRDNWDANHTADEWVDRFVRGGIGKLNLDDLSIDVIERTLPLHVGGKFNINELVPKHQTGRRL